MPRKGRRPRHKANQSPDPPRVPLTVLLPESIAHGIIQIAALERWSISRVIAEALTDYFQGRLYDTRTRS